MSDLTSDSTKETTSAAVSDGAAADGAPAASGAPKVTALHGLHAELGARFTDFGGWDMPLKYGKELEEHRAVRESAGVFDLSHMGEVRVTGPGAAAFLDHALISRISAVAPGKAKYSMICADDGGIIDDLIVYRLADEEFLVVPNAGNAPTVVAELEARRDGSGTADGAAFECVIADETDQTSLIAVQGPRAEEIVTAIVEPSDAGAADEAGAESDAAAPTVAGLAYYAAFPGVIDADSGAGISVLLARTGYTGEDGFELFVANADARATWDAVMAAADRIGAGESAGGDDTAAPIAVPCGLASRDTLRLEAGMPLYGNELSLEVTPVDAGLGILAATKSKETFVGRDAIVGAKESGPAKVLIALAGEGRRAARAGYPLLDADGNAIGAVTSGALSPTLGHPIAMAYVDAEAGIAAGLLSADDPAKPAPVEGAEVTVDIRGKAFPYVVVKPPFYKRT